MTGVEFRRQIKVIHSLSQSFFIHSANKTMPRAVEFFDLTRQATAGDTAITRRHQELLGEKL